MIPSEATDRAFKYVRYDVDLSPAGLSALGVAQPVEKLVMDNGRAMMAFREIGAAAASTVDVSSHFEGFIPAFQGGLVKR